MLNHMDHIASRYSFDFLGVKFALEPESKALDGVIDHLNSVVEGVNSNRTTMLDRNAALGQEIDRIASTNERQAARDANCTVASRIADQNERNTAQIRFELDDETNAREAADAKIASQEEIAALTANKTVAGTLREEITAERNERVTADAKIVSPEEMAAMPMGKTVVGFLLEENALLREELKMSQVRTARLEEDTKNLKRYVSEQERGKMGLPTAAALLFLCVVALLHELLRDRNQSNSREMSAGLWLAATLTGVFGVYFGIRALGRYVSDSAGFVNDSIRTAGRGLAEIGKLVGEGVRDHGPAMVTVAPRLGSMVGIESRGVEVQATADVRNLRHITGVASRGVEFFPTLTEATGVASGAVDVAPQLKNGIAPRGVQGAAPGAIKSDICSIQ